MKFVEAIRRLPVVVSADWCSLCTGYNIGCHKIVKNHSKGVVLNRKIPESFGWFSGRYGKFCNFLIFAITAKELAILEGYHVI